VPTVVCNLDRATRETELTYLAQNISGTGPFTDPGSVQSRALSWLIDDVAYPCPQDSKTVQRYVLAVFYYGTGGGNWDECSAPEDSADPESVEEANNACNKEAEDQGRTGDTDAWLGPSSECTWGGILCFSEGSNSSKSGCLEVISIDDNNLVGTLPFELQELSELRIFHAEGEEDRIGGLTGKLPPQLGNLKDLEEFDVNYNQLTGPIPDSFFGGLVKLRELDLNDNEFTGPISDQIRNLKELQLLQLHVNFFEGNITPALGELKKLVLLSVDTNRFKGSMPLEICENRVPNNGTLASLTADCADDTYEFYVSCPQGCCTFCY